MSRRAKPKPRRKPGPKPTVTAPLDASAPDIARAIFRAADRKRRKRDPRRPA